MKKDILIMCQYFYPEYVSSATLPTDLAEDLVKKRLSVDVICGYPKEYYNGAKVPNKEVYRGINICRVGYTKFNNKSKFGRIINFFSLFLSMLLRIPSLFKYKIIIVYSNPPILPLIPYFISCTSNTKYVFVAFDIYPDSALLVGAIRKGSVTEKIMHFINREVYSTALRIIVLGNEIKDYLIRNNIASKPDNLVVIPNWFNDFDKKDDYLIKSKEFKELRYEWSFIVLYSGNMGSMQDMRTILECMSRFKDNKDVLFLFTGHGNKVTLIKDYIEKEGLSNSRIYGFLKGDDFEDVLKIVDVALVSLEKGVEGLGVPSKTYGYLAAGKPVIAIMSDTTDISKNLKTYNAGDRLDQGDVDALERLILEYMNNKEELKLKGTNSRYIFEKLYRREICTDMYYDMISEIIVD